MREKGKAISRKLYALYVCILPILHSSLFLPISLSRSSFESYWMVGRIFYCIVRRKGKERGRCFVSLSLMPFHYLWWIAIKRATKPIRNDSSSYIFNNVPSLIFSIVMSCLFGTRCIFVQSLVCFSSLLWCIRYLCVLGIKDDALLKIYDEESSRHGQKLNLTNLQHTCTSNPYLKNIGNLIIITYHYTIVFIYSFMRWTHIPTTGEATTGGCRNMRTWGNRQIL